ncbi:MAG: thymidine kinase [Hyphomicrobiales bacterium]|nr:thymidine kinase [Hyphomicrobiales bacterium]
MAKLYFSYSAMNAGKSTALLQASHNYRERGMNTLIMTSALDDRTILGEIASRIGLRENADLFSPEMNLMEFIEERSHGKKIACVLIDEAQFLSEEQVWQLSQVVDDLDIPVLCYGLRTDFQAKLFPGSAALLAIADQIREIRTICWCGSKATMVLRLDSSGIPVAEGEQVDIGGNDKYISVCRAHWRALDLGPHDKIQSELPLAQ